MSDRDPEILPLRRHHGWKVKPGYKLFVADRGAARFAVPADWVIAPTEDHMRLVDRAPPDDDAAIGISLLHVPLHGLTATELLAGAHPGEGLHTLDVSEPTVLQRPGLDLAWTRQRHLDPSGREAFSIAGIAAGRGVCVLLTLDFWVDDVVRITPIWDEVLASIELGRYVADPGIGDVDQN